MDEKEEKVPGLRWRRPDVEVEDNPGADLAPDGRSSREQPLELLLAKEPRHISLPADSSSSVW